MDAFAGPRGRGGPTRAGWTAGCEGDAWGIFIREPRRGFGPVVVGSARAARSWMDAGGRGAKPWKNEGGVLRGVERREGARGVDLDVEMGGDEPRCERDD